MVSSMLGLDFVTSFLRNEPLSRECTSFLRLPASRSSLPSFVQSPLFALFPSVFFPFALGDPKKCPLPLQAWRISHSCAELSEQRALAVETLPSPGVAG